MLRRKAPAVATIRWARAWYQARGLARLTTLMGATSNEQHKTRLHPPPRPETRPGRHDPRQRWAGNGAAHRGAVPRRLRQRVAAPAERPGELPCARRAHGDGHRFPCRFAAVLSRRRHRLPFRSWHPQRRRHGRRRTALSFRRLHSGRRLSARRPQAHCRVDGARRQGSRRADRHGRHQGGRAQQGRRRVHHHHRGRRGAAGGEHLRRPRSAGRCDHRQRPDWRPRRGHPQPARILELQHRHPVRHRRPARPGGGHDSRGAGHSRAARPDSRRAGHHAQRNRAPVGRRHDAARGQSAHPRRGPRGVRVSRSRSAVFRQRGQAGCHLPVRGRGGAAGGDACPSAGPRGGVDRRGDRRPPPFRADGNRLRRAAHRGLADRRTVAEDMLMRILFLTHSFNSLSQRLYLELAGRGHEVSIEFDINDAVTVEAVALYRPDLIVAPFLKRAIPEEIWHRHVCLVVHPGIKGDRGPSALDWAILNGEPEWGVTVLQAAAEMDAGDIWAAHTFPMRKASKGSLYRNEVTEAAVQAVLEAVAKFEAGGMVPEPPEYGRPDVRGQWRPAVRQEDRAIDWRHDDTATVLRKIRSADGFPGVLDAVLGLPCYLYDAHPETALRGAPGEVIAQSCGMICRATMDGAVWIGHLKRKPGHEPAFKLPAAQVLGEKLAGVPENEGSWRDICYEEKNGVGILHFEFYNGAMSTAQCERLRAAHLEAARRDTRVIVLVGGADFWSNGIHLNLIEAAESPADASWANINAMNDLARAIIETDSHLTLSALQGNAGAGGVFLALAADKIVARAGAVLNPHYKAMGNLYGSEYWTYLLPRRVGMERAGEITENRLPMGTRQAKELGLIDGCFGGDAAEFRRGVEALAENLAADAAALLAAKRARRRRDEAEKPLAAYRDEELAQMKRNFYGFDPSYHVARYNFVHRVPHSRTPRHLALHRKIGGKWCRTC